MKYILIFAIMSLSMIDFAHADTHIQILIKTSYPKEKAEEILGRWWAICEDPDGIWQLKQVSVYADSSFEFPDVILPTSDCNYHSFWIRGDVSWLAKREVINGKFEHKAPDPLIHGKFKGRSLTLKAITEDKDELYAQKHLQFTYLGHSQIIHSGIFGYFDTQWIGDIDGDGRPDLHLMTTDHDHGGTNRLFISSSAKGSDLVKEVATHFERLH